MKKLAFLQQIMMALTLGVMLGSFLNAPAARAGDGSFCGPGDEGLTCIISGGPGTCTGGVCVPAGGGVPEMGDYLAISLILMGTGYVLYKRRTLKQGADK